MKSKRHLKIVNILKDENVSTQEELVERLSQEGVEVTQATISRDIKRLGLIKVPDGFGGYKYSLPSERKHGDIINWMKKLFEDFVVELDYSENIIVIHTLPGTAMGLASAIDNVGWQEVIGTVAGDDTILLVIKPLDMTLEIYNRIEKLLK